MQLGASATMAEILQQSVIRDKRQKHSEQPLRCPYCTQQTHIFQTDEDFKRHLKSKHENLLPSDRLAQREFRIRATSDARRNYQAADIGPSGDEPPPKRHETKNPQSDDLRRSRTRGNERAIETKILSQPETRPISQDQLVAEVKGIYAGLVMIEGKCIQVDLKQAQLAMEAAPGTQPVLKNEQYQALIALHRTLLHEHHDFFLASQHPSATPAVRRLAVKYAMPARLWRHGIHSFLELLRNRLPASLEYMLAFIYLAYSMMTLLLETVPSFEDTWIECLGDLGRYRMAIEDDHIHDREIWTQVARQWYLKSANRSPTTGRLYHHLAILARPDALPQLLYYGKSLSVPIPFAAAKESIMTLFEPILYPKIRKARCPPVITAFVKCHAILFTGHSKDTFSDTLSEYADLMDSYIDQKDKDYLEQGYSMAISNCMALMSYGNENNILAHLIKSKTFGKDDPSVAQTVVTADHAFQDALKLFNKTAEIHFRHSGNLNVLSYVHVTLVFLRYMAGIEGAFDLISPNFPWKDLCNMLNSVLEELRPTGMETIMADKFPRPADTQRRIDGTTLVIPEKPDTTAKNESRPSSDEFRPFPEEWAMRGLIWTQSYFPEDWFKNPNIEAEKHFMEAESMRMQERPERVLWLAMQLTKAASPLQYVPTTRQFEIDS